MRARVHRHLAGQRGAAIISALLVVALAAILVSGILWRQQVQLRRIENQKLISQVQWIARGALDWTRLILRSQADTYADVTYLGGIWSVPIAKTRLSDFLGQDAGADAEQGAQTYLSGFIEDAQAKFNLRNLVSIPAPGALQLNLTQIQAFQRLLISQSMNGELAKNVAVQLRAGLAQSAMRFQSPGFFGGTSPQMPLAGAIGGSNFTDKPGLSDDNSDSDIAPLQMTRLEALLDVPGFTPEMIEKLRPFVTILPTATPINMNTAHAEVIAAMVPGLTLSTAQALVARRETAFFRNTADIQVALNAVGLPTESVDSTQLDVTTSYFLVHGRIQYERAKVDQTTLIYRDMLTHSTRVVRVSDTL